MKRIKDKIIFIWGEVSAIWLKSNDNSLTLIKRLQLFIRDIRLFILKSVFNLNILKRLTNFILNNMFYVGLFFLLIIGIMCYLKGITIQMSLYFFISIIIIYLLNIQYKKTEHIIYFNMLLLYINLINLVFFFFYYFFIIFFFVFNIIKLFFF